MNRSFVFTILLFVVGLANAHTTLGKEPKQKAKERPPKDDSVQIHFVGPTGLHINWSTNGAGTYDSPTLVVPAAYDFSDGKHEFRLGSLPGRANFFLYPSITISSTDAKVRDFVSESRVTIQLTEEDFDQALAGNVVTKVVFLPDPDFEDFAIAGVTELISKRVDPGVDPIEEADRRGTIIAVVRIGNRNKEKPQADSPKAQPTPPKKTRVRSKPVSRGIAELNGVKQISLLGKRSSTQEIVSKSAE